MFRKLSLLVIVASFVSIKAADAPTSDAGFFSRTGSAVKGFVVAAVTPSTYTNAAKDTWNYLTWEHIKAAPGATFDAMKNNPGKTALVAASAAAVVAGIYAYLHPEVLGLENEEADENITMSTRNKDKTTTYFIGQE